MVTDESKDPKQAMSRYLTTLDQEVKKVILRQHMTTLKEYARRVLVDGEELPAEENQDRETRSREFLAIGGSFHLTEKQLVAHLYKGLFPATPVQDDAAAG